MKRPNRSQPRIRKAAPPAESNFRFVAGESSLDFGNTTDWTPAGDRWVHRNDLLRSYPDLVEWALAAGLLDEQLAKQLTNEAGMTPVKAARALRRAKELRDTVHGVFSAVADGRAPPAELLRALEERLRDAVGLMTFEPDDHGGYRRSYGSSRDLDRIARSVAWLASELVTSARLGKVRICAGERCGWLFLDESRNHLRKWCEMGTCGSRAKSRSYYERKKRSRDDS